MEWEWKFWIVARYNTGLLEMSRNDEDQRSLCLSNSNNRSEGNLFQKYPPENDGFEMHATYRGERETGIGWGLHFVEY